MEHSLRTEKQLRYDRAYLHMAMEWGKLSHCTRKKVGALIVRDGMIISDGYNGTPSGFDNCCEDDQGNTHWFVLHAEANAAPIANVAMIFFMKQLLAARKRQRTARQSDQRRLRQGCCTEVRHKTALSARRY